MAVAIMSFDALFTTVQVTAATAFAAKVRRDILAAFTVTNRLLYLVAVITVALLHGSYLAYVCTYVGADMIMALVLFVTSRRTIRFRWTLDPRAWRHTLASTLPLGAIQFIDNIYAWIDSILLGRALSSAITVLRSTW